MCQIDSGVTGINVLQKSFSKLLLTKKATIQQYGP